MRVTKLEININNFKHNIEEIRKYVNNKELMPVIKANAYGTHLNERLDLLNEFNIVAVAILDEAGYLRSIGYEKDIFILNQPAIEDIEEIFDINPVIGLSSIEFLRALKNIHQKIRVHLEIETGMNRTGIKKEDLPSFLKEIKLNKNIVVEGIYTHLSSADDDEEYTKKQINIFHECVDIIKKEIPNIKYIHSSASNGLLNYDDTYTNLVRPGIIMYGYESFKGVNNLIDIKPTCKLSTEITFLKEVEPNEGISYNKKYITKTKTKIATIPIGYADGLRRELTNVGHVLINDKIAPIIGTICMDSCMIDVTDIDCEVGDKVYLFDNEKITLDDIAKECNTINYEILCNISYRIPRVFIDE